MYTHDITGPDPDNASLGGGGPILARGQGGRLWVQGKTLVGGSGGGGAKPPRNKTIFSILNGFGELSFIMHLAYFIIFRVL